MGEGRLVPRAAMPYLDVALPVDSHHVELAPVRREALDVLAAGYRSTGRNLLGVLAWLATAGGASLLVGLPWLGLSVLWTAALAVLGAGLLAVGIWLAVGVLRSGRRITGAAAAWLRVPTAGATDTDGAVLLAVVRWRVVLAAAVATTTLVLTATLLHVLARTGALGQAAIGAEMAAVVPDAPRAFLLAALAVAALTTALAAAGTIRGIRTVAEAAWQRPTVISAPPAEPAAAVAAAVPVAAGQPVAAGVPVAAAQPAVAAGVPVVGAPEAEALDQVPTTAQPAPSAVAEIDGPPTVAIDLSALRADPAPQQLAPSAASSAQVEVVLPDGRVLREGTTLVGRRPLPRPEDLVDDVVVLTDQTVTKTHAAITVEAADVRVVDRASTNGTLLQAPDGSLSRCHPWQVTTVRVPAIIHLGRTRLHVRPVVTRRSLEVA